MGERDFFDHPSDAFARGGSAGKAAVPVQERRSHDDDHGDESDTMVDPATLDKAAFAPHYTVHDVRDLSRLSAFARERFRALSRGRR